MPAPVIVPSEGTLLGFSTTVGGTYTDIGGLLSVTPPKPKTNAVKTTTLADTIQTFRAGKQPDGGEFSFRIRYDMNNSDHQTLVSLVLTPASNAYWWKITYPDGKTTPANDKFQGIVTDISPQANEDEKNQEIEFTVKLTSTITRTAGA